MTEIEIFLLGEDQWEQFREIRLRALQQNPEAFANPYEEEAGYSEELWRERMTRSKRFVAFEEQQSVGVVSLSPRAPEILDDELNELAAADVFGLWVDPAARGHGVTEKLMSAASDAARSDERSHLVYWVGTDNARAVAFASGYGFRPTDARRQARTAGVEGGVEAAMVYPLTRN